MSNVIELLEDHHYTFPCPGCKMSHSVTVDGYKNQRSATWGWNGNLEKPTFTPSILVTWDWGEKHEKRRCHSFITNGVWRFLNDCTHELAGKEVPMEIIRE